MKYILLVFGLFTGGWVHAQDNGWFCDEEREGVATRWFDTELGKQKALIIYPKEASSLRLVVFIHGDSPFGDPVYQYYISRNIAEMTNAITVAILRPGYRDGCGDLSEGTKGLTMGDNYTQEVVNSLGFVIASIQKEEGISETVIIGHSGGAALTALLAESAPELANQSILLACPCNLPAWRQSMEKLTENPEWLEPMGGMSPLEGVANLDLARPLHLYVGDQDVVTPSFLTKEFYEATDVLGASVNMKIIPGEDHESIVSKTNLMMIFQEVGLIQE